MSIRLEKSELSSPVSFEYLHNYTAEQLIVTLWTGALSVRREVTGDFVVNTVSPVNEFFLKNGKRSTHADGMIACLGLMIMLGGEDCAHSRSLRSAVVL